jgi:hypothetical protein
VLHRSGWPELRPLLKASSILGLIAGGIGSWKVFSLVGLFIPAFVSQASWSIFLFLTLFLLLGGPLALVSSLCLFFLRLTDEQNDILGFLSFFGSVSIMVVLPYFFLASS